MIARWAEHDERFAIHDADRAAIGATEAVRSLVLDLFSAADERDLFNACARLGVLLAMAGASPTLAASTIDGAVAALDARGVTVDPSRPGPARAALVEAYVASIRDAERTASAALWDYPACAVPLADGGVAIACGYPATDSEALAAWAARTASRLVKAKAKRIVLAGPDAATSELTAAARLVGIDVGGGPPPTEQGVKAGWLRLPWRR